MMNSFIEMLVDLPFAWDLILRVTIVLALTWLIHLSLARKNPRWRVQLWRLSTVGLIAIVISLFIPRLTVFIHSAPSESRSFSSSPAGTDFEISMDEPMLLGSQMNSDSDYKYFVSALNPDFPVESLDTEPVEFIEVQPEKTVSAQIAENSWLIFMITWLSGVLILSARWFMAQFQVRNVLKRSNSVENLSLLNKIASEIQLNRDIDILMTKESDVPFVMGLFRPALILPEKMLNEKYREELPSILAHELMHIKSRDLLWMGAIQWVSIFLWFHPLSWRIGSVHSMACEEVADTVAAKVSGGVERYSGTLARVALEAVSHPSAVAALSMARSPQVLSRLSRLKKGLSSLPLNRKSVLISASAGMFLLAPLLIFELAHADLKSTGYLTGDEFVPGKTLEFPEDRSVGMLEVMFEKDRDYFFRFYHPVDYHNGPQANWKYFAEAQGKVTVPKGARVKLTLRKDGSTNTSWMKKLKPDDLYELFIFPHPGNQNSYPFGDQQAKNIGHLTGLVVLEVRPTQLTDKGMKFVESLQSLKSFTFYSPDLGNETLKSIGKMKSLELISTGYGKWDDKGLAYLSKLKNLKQIHLPCFDKPGPGFESLVSLPSLEYISGGLFKESHLKHLKGATQLKSLNLFKNEYLTNESLASLSHLTGLEQLNFSGTNITDDGLEHLKPLTSLKDLNLSVIGRREGPPVSDKGCAVLSEMPSLELLHFTQLGNVNESLMYLSRLPNLKSLWIGHLEQNTFLDETGLKHLARMNSLERLVLGGWGTRLDKTGLSYISELSNLQYLSINCSFDLVNKDLALLKPLVNLEYLNFNADNKEHQITIPALNHLNSLTSLKSLSPSIKPAKPEDETLNLSGLVNLDTLMCGGLRDQDLAGLANCTKMKNLQIGYNNNYSDEGLAYLANLKSLEHLCYGGEGFTDEGLKHLANMKNLRHLRIKGNLTEEGLKQIAKMKSLFAVTVTTKSKINEEVIKQMYNSLPNIGRFNVKQDLLTDWKRQNQQDNKKLKKPGIGQVAPPFNLKSVDSKQISSADLQGKVTLLYFWSTSCKPCVASMPKLNEAYKQLSQFEDFAMIGFSGDESEYLLKEFLKKEKVTWPQIRLGQDSVLEAAYGIRGYPNYVLIGRDGKILHVGGGKGLDTALQKALVKNPG